MLPVFTDGRVTNTQQAADCIGRTEAEAAKFLESHGHVMRVMQRDGEILMGTYDLCDNRINVAVNNGRVTAILGCG